MYKKNQIWIETVIYTLIGLAIIGVLLAFVKPAIDEKKDQILLQQTVEMLNNIDNEVEDVVFYGTGNSRVVEVGIKKGKLEIDSIEDSIRFSMNSRYMFSEPGQEVEMGRIKANTTKKTKTYDVVLLLDYRNKFNVTWNGKEIKQTLQASPTPYELTIKNLGKEASGLTEIDFS
jgi:hypothetical protein